MRARVNESSSQAGQAAVLISLCLFSLVVFLAMATNMGILVNDRIRMQNTADLSAYAGAFEQARALNRLTAINHRIYTTAYNIRKGLTCAGMPPNVTPEIILNSEPIECQPNNNPLLGDHRAFPKLPGSCRPFPDPEKIMDFGQLQMDALAAVFKLENYRAKETSIRAARITATRNFFGMHRPDQSNFYEFWAGGRRKFSPTVRAKPLIEVDRVFVNFTYVTFAIPGICGCPIKFPPRNSKVCWEKKERTLEAWYYKLYPGPTVYFPARVQGVPWKDFLDVRSRDGGYFGADAARGRTGDDVLWGFAVAKPFGGSVGTRKGAEPFDPPDAIVDEDSKNFTVSIDLPIIGHQSKDFDGWDYQSFDDNDMEDGFVEKYRARMAGIRDTMLVDVDGTDDSREIEPIQLMMADLVRATHTGPTHVTNFTRH